MADFSFDVVSEVDWQEVINSVDQAEREIATRYDFKDSHSEIKLDKEKNAINLVADDEMTLQKIIDVLLTKLIKRAVPVKSLVYGKTEPTGRVLRKEITIQQGLSKEQAKEVIQVVKDSKLKVQTQINGELVRVSSKSKDDLQKVIQTLKSQEFKFDIQFKNYR